jgi:hypothetical protein
MRNFALSAAVLLLALLLLYGGLNLAEHGMSRMLDREQAPQAFAMRRIETGTLLITFSGRTFVLSPGRVITGVGRWWERLRAD